MYAYSKVLPLDPALDTHTQDKGKRTYRRCCAAVVILCILAIVATVVNFDKTDTAETRTNTSDIERLLDWWQPGTTEASFIDLNITKTMPLPDIAPPSCCWPVTESTRNSCKLFNTHSVYCATKRHPECKVGTPTFEACPEPWYNSSRFTCTPGICCKAMTASCLSCTNGVPVEVLCACKPKTLGC